MEQSYKNEISILLSKIQEADAILVGAAAGMSIACGYNFFMRMTVIFKSILKNFIGNTDILVLLTGFIINILLQRHVGHFLPEWDI